MVDWKQRERGRRSGLAETDQNVLNPVHAVVREMVGIPRNRSKPVYAVENWPDYHEEEAPDGFFLQDGKIFWHPNWSNLRTIFFENLVNTAIRKCAEDDQFALLKSKPTNDELRGRAIDYLDSVVREKKKAEATKRAETTVKSIKSRTARFRMWLASNWKSTPLDSCKERDLLKRALLPDNGILRNLHFLEHDEADIFKSPTESRSGSAEGDEDGYDEFLLLADIHHGGKVDRPGWAAIEPWWWSPIIRLAVWTGYESWPQAQEKSKRRSTPVFHQPHMCRETILWISASPAVIRALRIGLSVSSIP